VYPALPSSWEETFSHLFPALRGLERPVSLPFGRMCYFDLSIESPGFTTDPVSRLVCVLISLPGGTGQ
jgi:hypothetical protein